MDYAEKNDIVIINYTISYLDGQIFDTTKNKEPLKFKLGKGIFIPGLEDIVSGMFIGQVSKKTLPSNKAFGPKIKELIKKIPIEDVPEHINKKVGQKIQIETNPPLKATITEISEEYIIIDANPKQAGQKLTIEVELLDIIREL
tara:strand:- start:345 stop:776 length:432 start_codon:yes stop_codon:yes gene_type:complete